MAENRGKKFEQVVRECFERINDVSVDRLHDQTNGFNGSQNICDFIVYRKPYEYYIECKSIHDNTLSIHSNPKPDKRGVLHGFYGNITDTQWEGLLEKSQIEGVFAGIICWWVDKDVTKFIPIQLLQKAYDAGLKSIRFDYFVTDGRSQFKTIIINGKKKRVFFDYDMEGFLNDLSSTGNGI